MNHIDFFVNLFSWWYILFAIEIFYSAWLDNNGISKPYGLFFSIGKGETISIIGLAIGKEAVSVFGLTFGKKTAISLVGLAIGKEVAVSVFGLATGKEEAISLVGSTIGKKAFSIIGLSIGKEEASSFIGISFSLNKTYVLDDRGVKYRSMFGFSPKEISIFWIIIEFQEVINFIKKILNFLKIFFLGEKKNYN